MSAAIVSHWHTSSIRSISSVDNLQCAPESESESLTSSTGSSSVERSSRQNEILSKLTFTDLRVHPDLVTSLRKIGWQRPTRVQAATIPLAIKGRDIVVSAETGSGKTGSFLIPFLNRILNSKWDKSPRAVRGLVLVPTRELALQCAGVFQSLTSEATISVAIAVGGLKLRIQEEQLKKKPTMVVATAGRMIDHLRNFLPPNYLNEIISLTLDEADRLLHPGFELQLLELLRFCRKSQSGRQTSLFSATLSSEMKELSKLAMRDPVKILLSKPLQTVKALSQEVMWIDKASLKEGALMNLLSNNTRGKTLVFVNHKYMASKIAFLLNYFGFAAAELHGDLETSERLHNLEEFRRGASNVMVSSDLGSRGLDINGIHWVINFDAPRSLKTYVHRVGRTARMGVRGSAITFFTEGEESVLKQVTAMSMEKRVAPKIRLLNLTEIKLWKNRIRRSQTNVTTLLREIKHKKSESLKKKGREKQQNMIRYMDEISQRPKRTWFQTPEAKRSEYKKSAFADGVLVGKARRKMLIEKRKNAIGGRKRDRRKQQERGTQIQTSFHATQTSQLLQKHPDSLTSGIPIQATEQKGKMINHVEYLMVRYCGMIDPDYQSSDRSAS
eukprot:CAMPEP_0114505626 /NCGR_PEP_ID=MMETSP0109-20121206/10959_1 /TAXON_ID=29199 /ORGANISM="Chlorarachnion reptans, Strain CCCM449" /LENGTH=613 /DNA_ID=CAMNT_0001684089 /DNA_START=519 /DNA_END=2358 /DNA_ORIENTATION=+